MLELWFWIQHFVHACPEYIKDSGPTISQDTWQKLCGLWKTDDKINGVLNYCSEFCRERHSV